MWCKVPDQKWRPLRSARHEKWKMQNARRGLLQAGKAWWDDIAGNSEEEKRKGCFKGNEEGLQRNFEGRNELSLLSNARV